MWEDLETVDWAALEHNYGPADDVPDLLRRCALPVREDAEDAVFDLLNKLHHQGGWICSAAPAALPFLLRLAAAPEVPARMALLEVVGVLAAEERQVAADWVDDAWPDAWGRALPAVIALLAAPEPDVRRSAAYVVGVCASPWELTLPALLDRWAVEPDRTTRLDLALSIGEIRGQVTGTGREAAPVAEAGRLLTELLDGPDPQLRLAAVHALAGGDPDLATRRMAQVVAAVRSPDVDVWRSTSWIEGGARAVIGWGRSLYRDDPRAAAAYTLAVGFEDGADDPEARIAVLAESASLLSAWRSPTAALAPAVADRLADPETEVRFLAAELLACLGPDAAEYADRLAELLPDPAVRSSRLAQTVGDAAIWALARIGDRRCLPGLVERLSGARLGFGLAGAHFGSPGGIHFPALPGIHEVLAPLADHADLLLPAVRTRLRRVDLAVPQDRDLALRLCDALAEWGPAAAPALPELLDLLADDRSWRAAASALAGLGDAAAPAAEPLLARALGGDESSDLAAWAHWRVGGEPGPALELLGRTVRSGGGPHPALRRLADLGPLAAGLAADIRPHTGSHDGWTAVEASHALWAVTGDEGPAVAVLTRLVGGLAEGRYLPVMLPALRYLAELGTAARPAAELLGGVPDSDRRLAYFGGWRAFTEDERTRAALARLLAATA